jgi:hypothetical protein
MSHHRVASLRGCLSSCKYSWMSVIISSDFSTRTQIAFLALTPSRSQKASMGHLISSLAPSGEKVLLEQLSRRTHRLSIYRSDRRNSLKSFQMTHDCSLILLNFMFSRAGFELYVPLGVFIACAKSRSRDHDRWRAGYS